MSDGSLHRKIHICIRKSVQHHTNKTGRQNLRDRKTRSTNRGVLHLILVHATNRDQSLNLQLELDVGIRIVVGNGLVLVPHWSSQRNSDRTRVLSSIHVGVSLAVITIRLDDHERILLASKELSFSELRSTDNSNIQRGHFNFNINLLRKQEHTNSDGMTLDYYGS